ncbi:MAG: family 1 glycosylhydrolase [Spirochaetia bacterium]
MYNKTPSFEKQDGLLKGVATAAYQIEGAAAQDGRGQSIWDVFSHCPGKIKPGHIGDVACDHYNRMAEDVELMRSLGIEAYRFSLSWPRILPEGRGRVNEKGIDFYSRLVDQLLEAGITPFATIFHWDLPQALQQEYGGFANRRIVEDFADYSELLGRRLGDRVRKWITINEPWVYSILGHLLGAHAPGKKNPWAAMRVVHHTLLAHAAAVERLRSVLPAPNAKPVGTEGPELHSKTKGFNKSAPDCDNQVEIGITLNLLPIYPQAQTKQMSESGKDRRAVDMADQFVNRLFLDPLLKGEYPPELWDKLRLFRPKVRSDDMGRISDPIDFIGINNYTRERAEYRRLIPFVHFFLSGLEVPEAEYEKEGVQYTSMGWEVYPEGIYELLTRMKRRYGNPPVYITENGAAFTDRPIEEGGELRVHDPLRREYIKSYLGQVEEARREGCNVKGYFVWTLMDNFEWAEGYDKRFGLVYVDYAQGQRRIVKDSGYWYRDYIRGAQ